MTTQRVGAQSLANHWVGAGHGYGDPRPVANMAPRSRENLNRYGVGPLEHPRQVADHAPGSVSQSLLDRAVQILNDLTERARNLDDDYLTYGTSPGSHLPRCGRAPDRLRWQLRRQVARQRCGKGGRVRAHPAVGGKIVHIAGGLDGKLVSVVPGGRARATKVREQHGQEPARPWSGGTQPLELYT